jgi:hypothetical protein
MEIRCEINEFNEISLYYDENDYPTLFQPHWPNGDEWASREEAQAWADLYIASATIEEAPYAPNGRGEEGLPKPTAEQIAAYKAEVKAQEEAREVARQAARGNNS